MRKAREHIKICIEIRTYRMKENRFFVFEHPAEVLSWTLPEVEGLMKSDDAYVAELDMCRFGLKVKDRDGIMKPARKSTRMIANSWEVARR